MYYQNGSYKFISETSGQVSASNIHAYLHHADTESFLGDIYIQKISESSKKETAFELREKWRYYTYLWIERGTTLTDFKMKFILKRADDNSEYVQNEQKEYNLAVQKNMLQNDYFDTEKEICGGNGMFPFCARKILSKDQPCHLLGGYCFMPFPLATAQRGNCHSGSAGTVFPYL